MLKILLSLFVALGLLHPVEAFAKKVTKPKPAAGTKIETKDLVEITILKKAKKGAAEATPGSRVFVHYKGTLEDGKVFDTSKQKGRGPFDFVLGTGQVIKGWDVGVEGMKVGEKRLLNIPPERGYGERGVGGVIPPNAKLIFEVELLDVKKSG